MSSEENEKIVPIEVPTGYRKLWLEQLADKDRRYEELKNEINELDFCIKKRNKHIDGLVLEKEALEKSLAEKEAQIKSDRGKFSGMKGYIGQLEKSIENQKLAYNMLSEDTAKKISALSRQIEELRSVARVLIELEGYYIGKDDNYSVIGPFTVGDLRKINKQMEALVEPSEAPHDEDTIRVCKPHGYTNCFCDVNLKPVFKAQKPSAKCEHDKGASWGPAIGVAGEYYPKGGWTTCPLCPSEPSGEKK